jgi:hypothetical protein
MESSPSSNSGTCADNSLSQPTQKAAAEKLIATPGLATVEQADMVTGAGGEKTCPVSIAAADTAAATREPREC